jgi:putative nucleotidyltransferase-like protein
MSAVTAWFEARAVHGSAEASDAGLLALLASPTPNPGLGAALGALPSCAIPLLLERIARHGLDGLAHRALADLPQARIHPWLRSALRRRHQWCAAATMSQGLALAELLETLHGAGIPAVVLGGMATVEASYGDPGARSVDHHDLLLRRHDLEAAGDRLSLLGYIPEGPGRYRRGGIVAVLQDVLPSFHGSATPASSALVPGAVMDRATAGWLAGAPALLPALEDGILLGVIDLVRNSFDRLIRVADLAHLLARRRSAVCWETLDRRAHAAGASRSLAFALEMAAILGAPVRAAFRLQSGTSFVERVLMRRALDLRPIPGTGRILTLLDAATARARRTWRPAGFHSSWLRRVS